jgi:DNA-binding CsgD family transcriptional regulator/GAF domain-containing protein
VEEVADLLGAAIERRRAEERALEIAAAQSGRAEAAERRFELLTGANALLLASSTDYATTLRNTVRLAVPALADWCFADVLEPGGDFRRVTAGHAGGAPGSSPEIADEFARRYPLDPNLPHGTPRVLKTGGPELLGEVEDGVLRSIATDPENLAFLRRLTPRSYMCVPLRTRRGWIGAIGFVASEGGRRYGEEDLALATGLAHCAALALDNAASHLPEVEMAREIVRMSGASGSGAAVVAAPDGDAQNLTRRQREVLGLMAEGRTAWQIANHLHISEDTVRNHIRAIKQALDAGSQLEAIAQARRLGVLPR